MDWLCVGSNGFAQVGSENYFAKSKAEMKYLLELIRDKFPIPEELKTLCRFAVKYFSHDFGTYSEIVVHFDDDAIGDGYDEEGEGSFMTEQEYQAFLATGAVLPEAKETPLHDLFWNWFNKVEAFDIESEEITQAIEAKYLGTLNLSKGEHLSIVQVKEAS